MKRPIMRSSILPHIHRRSMRARRLAMQITRGVLVLCLLCVGLPSALAEKPFTLPLIRPLRQMPLGTWAAYELEEGAPQKITQRFALVARTGELDIIEMEVHAPSMGQQTLHLQMFVEADPKKKGQVRKMLAQVNQNPPMQLPVENAMSLVGMPRLIPVDPRRKHSVQYVETRAGRLETELYKTPTTPDEALRVWLSRAVPPLGIVRLEVANKGRAELKMRLVTKGKGAVRRIRGRGDPFDGRKLMQQLLGR